METQTLDKTKNIDRTEERATKSLNFKPDVRGYLARSRAAASDIANLCIKASAFSSQPLPEMKQGETTSDKQNERAAGGLPSICRLR
jgi:hypothetical protein